MATALPKGGEEDVVSVEVDAVVWDIGFRHELLGVLHVGVLRNLQHAFAQGAKEGTGGGCVGIGDHVDAGGDREELGRKAHGNCGHSRSQEDGRILAETMQDVNGVADPEPSDAARGEVDAKADLWGVGEEGAVPFASVPEDQAAVGEVALIGGEPLPRPGDLYVRLEGVDRGRLDRDGDTWKAFEWNSNSKSGDDQRSS